LQARWAQQSAQPIARTSQPAFQCHCPFHPPLAQVHSLDAMPATGPATRAESWPLVLGALLDAGSSLPGELARPVSASARKHACPSNWSCMVHCSMASKTTCPCHTSARVPWQQLIVTATLSVTLKCESTVTAMTQVATTIQWQFHYLFMLCAWQRYTQHWLSSSGLVQLCSCAEFRDSIGSYRAPWPDRRRQVTGFSSVAAL
jgi:hypothetical protein